jgi:hypothetical protein
MIHPQKLKSLQEKVQSFHESKVRGFYGICHIEDQKVEQMTKSVEKVNKSTTG